MAVVLYKRQRQILEFIHKFIKQYGYSPTLAEVGKALGMRSPATVHEHLRALERKGIIRKIDGQIRGVEIIQRDVELFTSEVNIGAELPLLGYIHAGAPLEPYEDPNATFKVSANLVPQNKKSYVLKVKGDSMIEDGILAGDYVVLVKDDSVRDGDVVVALLPSGLATLKRIYQDSEHHRVILKPANSAMEPIYAPSVQVQGRLCALIRKYS